MTTTPSPSTPLPGPSRHQGALLLADISGYTGFIQGVADAHRDLIVDAPDPPPAYGMMSGLLDAIVVALEPTFKLAKLEGDAVFAVAEDGEGLDGGAVLATLSRCYRAFRSQLLLAGSQRTCTCTACVTMDSLDLKFIVHHGSHVAQRIAGQVELLGPDVNLAHRLLKNHARDVVGPVPYALFTAAATDAFAIPTDGMAPSEESPEGMLPVAVHILVLEVSPGAAPA